jgi:hypothetical protein
MTALILVCLASLLIFLVERAVDLAIILTQLLVFFSIFLFFRCFLGPALNFRIFKVGLLGHRLVSDSLGILAGNYNSTTNLAVVGIVCGVSAYLTLLVSQTF